jgi:hypothetical protein
MELRSMPCLTQHLETVRWIQIGPALGFFGFFGLSAQARTKYSIAFRFITQWFCRSKVPTSADTVKIEGGNDDNRFPGLAGDQEHTSDDCSDLDAERPMSWRGPINDSEGNGAEDTGVVGCSLGIDKHGIEEEPRDQLSN